MTLGVLTQGRTEFLQRHMVWSDKASCRSASTGREVGGGLDAGGAENSFRWGVEGVDILGYHCQRSVGRHVSLGFFKRKSGGESVNS